MRELVNAARLGLENERLQALAQARLAEVRRSRIGIVEAGDEERRRLERDLHDGAQQRLVTLSIALQILRRRHDADAIATAADDNATAELLDLADAELRAALVDVRDIAHGIYPAVLAEEGLAAGVESLVEGSMTQVTVEGVPQDRFDPPVEIACYLVVAEGTRQGTGHHARVDIRRSAGNLVVDVEHDGGPSEIASDLGDRISALDGTIFVRKSDDGRVAIHAEIRCAF
jgi:signal transduction histidine kinase